MKTIRDYKDAQLAINELFEFKQRFESQNPDLKGRRFTNVGDAINLTEYCTLGQLRIIKQILEAEINKLKLENERLEERIKALETA
jgi:hypothetical protein